MRISRMEASKRASLYGLSVDQYAYVDRKRNIERCADANWKWAMKRNAMEARVTEMRNASLLHALEYSQRRQWDVKQKLDASMRRILAHKTVLKQQQRQERKLLRDSRETNDNRETFISSIRKDIASALQRVLESMRPENVRQKRIDLLLEKSRRRYREVLERSLKSQRP